MKVKSIYNYVGRQIEQLISKAAAYRRDYEI